MTTRHTVPWLAGAPFRRVPQLHATRYPLIDIHNHLGRWLTDGSWMVEDVDALVAMMDEQDVDMIVNLDGLWGDELTANINRYDRAHPGRFLTFCQLDWALLAERDGVERLRAWLSDSVERGARGLKIWKNLGESVRDRTPDGREGEYILQDDPRVIEVVRHAGELGLPVLIHTADRPTDDPAPAVLAELRPLPGWWVDRIPAPDLETLLDAHERLVLACPDVRFIGTSLASSAHDLDRVERLLASAPHYTVDISRQIEEIGRNPGRFAALMARYPDRIAFGTNCIALSASVYAEHRRFCETGDAFRTDPEFHRRYRWPVTGLDLNPDLLPGLYRDNAARVLGLTRTARLEAEAS